MHVITQDGILWRTLSCPIPPGQRHRLQGVRLAGPEPLSAPRLTIQRKVSSRGGIQVARQRIQVGFLHAGQAVTIELGSTTLRVIDRSGELITTVPVTALARPPGSRPTGPGILREAGSLTCAAAVRDRPAWTRARPWRT